MDKIIGECRTYSDQVDTHEHPYAQLILPLQGNLFIQTHFDQFTLNEQQLFWLPPCCLHTFYSNDRNEFLVLDIPTFCFSANLSGSEQKGVRQDLDDRWQALRFLILSEIRQSHYSLNELFHYAQRLLKIENTPKSIRYIQANYDRSLSIETLANIEGYTFTYYCEWFKTLTGVSPKQYIQTLRLNKAKELLRETDLPVWQIAQQVGYTHHASLTRLFQQLEQTTPQAYRQQTRN